MDIYNIWERRTHLKYPGVDERRSVACGTYPKDPPVITEFSFHDFLSVVYVLRGEGSYQDSTHGEIKLSPGSLLFRQPGLKHRTVPVTGSDWLEFYLDLPPASYQLFCEMGLPLKSKPVWQPGLQDELLVGLEAIRLKILSKNITGLPATVLEMQAWVIKAWHFHKQQLSANSMLKVIYDICEYFAYGKDWISPLPQVAERYNLDYDQFRKEFKRVNGETPQVYRNLLRVDYACSLLINTRSSVALIARQLQYADIYTFSRAFKALTGQSPSQYRKKVNLLGFSAGTLKKNSPDSF